MKFRAITALVLFVSFIAMSTSGLLMLVIDQPSFSIRMHPVHKLFGVLLILGAKVVGTAVVAHLFALTQPALMRLPWFARYYTRWSGWKAALLARVRTSWFMGLACRARRQAPRRSAAAPVHGPALSGSMARRV